MDNKKTGEKQTGGMLQDELTENQSKPRGPVRDEQESKTELDPDVDSGEADRAMAEDRFGQNQKRQR